MKFNTFPIKYGNERNGRKFRNDFRTYISNGRCLVQHSGPTGHFLFRVHLEIVSFTSAFTKFDHVTLLVGEFCSPSDRVVGEEDGT